MEESILWKRVCAYCRVSTNTKDQENSFDNQHNYFEREITKNPNYEFCGIYADKGITGTSLTKRKDFNRILTDAGLDINDGCRIIAEPKFDMIYVKNTSKKVRFGMREGANKGNIFVDFNLYGYKYVIHPENKLEIVEEEAEVVREIYKLYLDGYGSERIVHKLAEDGHFTRKNKIFTSTTILGMLKNEKYVGLNYGIKFHTGEWFGDRRKRNMPENTQVRFETDKIPPIISKETFYKAQKKRESNISCQNNKGRYLGKTECVAVIVCGLIGRRCKYLINSHIYKL